MKLLLWTNIPNHYQSSFISALRKEGFDIAVFFYEKVHADRLALGWSSFNQLSEGEYYVEKNLNWVKVLPDWKERIHIVPGAGSLFLVRLMRFLSENKVKWLHWSEPSQPGLRRLFTWPFKRWYSSYINRFALGALAIGNNAVKDFRNWGIKPQKIGLLTYSAEPRINGVGYDGVSRNFKKDKIAFLFLGALNKRKGVDLLLRAAKLLQAHSDDFVVILVGRDDSKGYYKNLAKKLNIEEKVLFRGPIPPSEISAVLNSSDILVLPSRYDGWGVVVNEAICMGLPVIVSDRCGSASHLVENNKNGFVFKSGDFDSLAGVMMNYLEDPGLIKRQSPESKRIFNLFSPARNAVVLKEQIQKWLPV